MHCINELCYILIISISNFLIFIHFTNQKTLKPSLAQKLKLIFKFSTIKGKINAPLWTPTWGIKNEERMEINLKGAIPLH